MDIKIGNTARAFRESLGLSQTDAAKALGVTNVHLSNVERNQSAPSPALIDKYREIWGVDLYVMAWCLHGNFEKLPEPLRKPANELAKRWQRHLDEKLANLKKSSER